MQQHNKSSKQRTLRLFLTYIVMTVAVIAISAICILLVLGYRFDPKKGDVEQGALLQFRSFPASATISLDKENLSFTTPGKRNVSAGNHTVTYTLSGYHEWQRSFKTHPSELLWLNYARLIPTQLTPTAVRTMPTATNMLPSPDKKWLIVQHAADSPEFQLVDIRDSKKPIFTTIKVPQEVLSDQPEQPHQFALEEWDFGARYVLVKHTVGSVSEYIRIDRTSSEPSSAINVSTKLGISISKLHFSGTSGTQFYALESGNLRKLDASAGTISQPLVKDVTSFELYKEDDIAFVRRASAEKQEVGIRSSDKLTTIATYDASQPVLVDITSYFSDYYVAVARGTAVELFTNPASTKPGKKPMTITQQRPVEWLRFANSGRFVTAGVGTNFSTYDIETKNTYHTAMPGGDVADKTKPLQWLDDYYLVSTAGNEVRFTEFDGMNQHTIAPTLGQVHVALTDDGKVLYSLAKQPDGTTALFATKLVVKD